MTAQHLRLDGRTEVRSPDATGHLVALAERTDQTWTVYPDLTTHPDEPLVLAAATRNEAEQILAAAWPDAVDEHAAQMLGALGLGGAS